MRSLSRAGVAGFFVMAASAAPAFADVIFTDTTFNLANYTASPSFASIPGDTIVAAQCAACGLPGSAVQFTASFNTAPVATVFVAMGLANTTFSYNPLTQGAIASIDASVSKNIFTDFAGTGFGNSFRPLILQNGIYYLALVPGPTFNGPGGPGYLAFSATNLHQTDFVSFDFTTGLFGVANPDFAGNPLLLGVAQISSVGANTPVPAHIVTQYDNLVYGVRVPEPGAIGIFGLALLGLYWSARRRT